MESTDLTFAVDGTTLQGRLWRAAEGPAGPTVILSHGLSGIVDLDLGAFAAGFVTKGINCFAYDHRNWGRSGGWPRGESDPWRQVADMRAAISHVRNLPELDPQRIGLWGTSYAGGHVLTVCALDRRVKAGVAQVPLVSGSRTFDSWIPANKRAAFIARVLEDQDARARGAPPLTTRAAHPDSESAQWIATNDKAGVYRNELTLQSFELLRSYEPATFAAQISPTPLLMIVANRDTQTPTPWQLETFVQIGEPKKLVQIDCRHYDVYMSQQVTAMDAAADWFVEHL